MMPEYPVKFTFTATPKTGDVCPHGSLRRSCEICERDERIAELEADVARLRDYALADAYCPCCATSEGEHAEECDHETDRMRAARAALKGRG